MDDSPELPEPIIHRIQSLLTLKKATQTILLNKSWGAARSTRPTIDLVESHLPYDHLSNRKIDGLVVLATKNFRLYEESNLRIDTFRLCLESEWYGLSGLATKWTLKALKLGATDLTFRLKRIAIPLDELFGSENVVRLCFKDTTIPRLNVLKCRGLKSLTLTGVGISRYSLFNIISCCPLIEFLSLSNIFPNRNDDDDDEQVQGLVSGHKLTSLFMCVGEYAFKKLSLDDFLSMFPNLKELTLKVWSPKEIQPISIHSLEILNLSVGNGFYSAYKEKQRVELDVPSIRKFTFEGKCMPNLCFRSTSDQWEESHVSLTLTHDVYLMSTIWFSELSNFFKKLRLSKIHLCLHVHNTYEYERKDYDYQEGEIDGLNVHEVEDVTISNKGLHSLSLNALLDGLFRICRPKMITQYVSPPDDDDDDGDMHDEDKYSYDDESARNNDIFLCRALKHVMNVQSLLLPTHFNYGLIDLDEIIAQKLFDDVWRPQPMDSILDVSTSEQGRFRFQLKWKQLA